MRINAPSCTNLQGLEYMLEGGAMGDMVVLIGTVDPRLMLVARHEGRVVGFVFAPPDLLQNSDPRGIDTIVIKTVAILPREKYSGLGRLLITDMLHNAQSMGYRRAISALMHTGNSSMSISADCAGPMRGYELFARCLNS